METSFKGHIEWRKDLKWDKPMVDAKDRARYQEIDTWLANSGLLCRIYGGEYMFVDTSNYWCNLASVEAMGRINVLVGILNATVNIEKAVRQFHKYIVKRCNVNVGKSIPTSVCVGTERLEIEVDEESQTIKFVECRPLLKVGKSADPAVSRVCIMPIDTDVIPRFYEFPGRGDILLSLMKLFPDLRSLLTVLWHIGNCLVDPVSRPKCLMACGPGGSGKSTLLQQMYACLTGCCGVLPDGSLVGKSRSMPSEIAEVIASCRMALCYDVDLEKEPLNMSIFKNISGSDYIRVGFNSVKTNCSLTLATNGVVNIDKQPEYLEDAIMRRTASILMNVNALSIPNSIIPEDSESRMDFSCAAIYIRMTYNHMPISPYDLLLTMCQSRIDDALVYIEEATGDINMFDGLEVINILSEILRITPSSVVFKAKLVTPLATMQCGEYTILRGLTLRR
jgi:hypothetical protein